MRIRKTVFLLILAAALAVLPATAEMTAEQAKQIVLDYDAALFKGAAWYVSAEGACLGKSKAIFKWDFFTTQPVAAVFEEDETDGFANRFRSHIEGDTEIFASNTQPGGINKLNAWIVTPEDRVIEPDTGHLIALDATHGALLCLAGKNDLDYCFLCVDGGELKEIAATPIDEATVNGFYGGWELLEELKGDGYAPTGFLYRFTDPLKDNGATDLPAAGGVITVNLEKGGTEYHAYFYEEPLYGGLYATRGWENEIATFDGPGSARRDVGLAVVQTEIG